MQTDRQAQHCTNCATVSIRSAKNPEFRPPCMRRDNFGYLCHNDIDHLYNLLSHSRSKFGVSSTSRWTARWPLRHAVIFNIFTCETQNVPQVWLYYNHACGTFWVPHVWLHYIVTAYSLQVLPTLHLIVIQSFKVANIRYYTAPSLGGRIKRCTTSVCPVCPSVCAVPTIYSKKESCRNFKSGGG